MTMSIDYFAAGRHPLTGQPLTFWEDDTHTLDLHHYDHHPTSRPPTRGGRYIEEKLSKADKLVFLKLSANYRYRKMEILKLSKNYRYRKMHQILADK